MRFPLRRIVLGFAVGASAGWVASLLHRPKDAPPGTGADAAEHMPQEEFGDLAGSDAPDALEGAEEIAQEPTAPAEAYEEPAAAETPAEDEKPAPDAPVKGGARKRPRKALPETVTPPPGAETVVGETVGESEPAKPAPRRRANKDAVKTVSEPVTEAVREGRAEVTERLAGLEDSVAPAATPVAPETRRRRKRTE